LALLVTHTNLSVSSGVGFLALFGVSVQTGVIMVEYINQLRARGYTIEQSAAENAVLRLRPIVVTMLVATLVNFLPHSPTESDRTRSTLFAIVIVGGLLSNLMIGIFLLPTLYAWFARDGDQDWQSCQETMGEVSVAGEQGSGIVGLILVATGAVRQLVTLLHSEGAKWQWTAR
jgi:Cu/Ag efflux pump CusA